MDGTAIDTASGTEHIESVEPESFRKNIASFANDREQAAKAASQHIDSHREIFFLTDSSCLDTGQTDASVA